MHLTLLARTPSPLRGPTHGILPLQQCQSEPGCLSLSITNLRLDLLARSLAQEVPRIAGSVGGMATTERIFHGTFGTCPVIRLFDSTCLEDYGLWVQAHLLI